VGRNAEFVTDEPVSPVVFDRLQKATASDPTELADLYREYLVEARRTLEELHSALLHRNAEELRTRAHYLKGSSQVVGATVVGRYCAALEEKGRNGDLGDAERLLDQTIAALALVSAELTKKLGAAAVHSAGSTA
jgi:HPt (histidine-containing phosphotransfer) domain-containing protein